MALGFFGLERTVDVHRHVGFFIRSGPRRGLGTALAKKFGEDGARDGLQRPARQNKLKPKNRI
jgi:hypothetical protein